jgi:hypothetical protein
MGNNVDKGGSLGVCTTWGILGKDLHHLDVLRRRMEAVTAYHAALEEMDARAGTAIPAVRRSVGAVTATLLKAFFDESRVVTDPVQPDPADHTRLVPF